MIRAISLMGVLALTLCCAAVDEADRTAPSTKPTTKKGVCLTTGKNNKDTWQAKVKALNASWHYSWGATLPADEPQGVEFVPMIWGYWGAGEKFNQTIDALTQRQLAGKVTHLLGFNEPDNKNQSNLTVARALEAWPHLERTGLRLGSPGPVHADRQWLETFMQQAKQKGCRIDFVCVHWYGGPNADGLVRHLTKIHKMYGKPIWITEFAVADWKAETREENRHSPEKVLRFMKEVLPRLDQLDFVERYAWFSGGPDHKALGPSALFGKDGSLTELGRFYAAHVSPPARAISNP